MLEINQKTCNPEYLDIDSSGIFCLFERAPIATECGIGVVAIPPSRRRNRRDIGPPASPGILEMANR
jgi:hypothetical protein